MGTRSGSIDPAIIPFVMMKTGKSVDEVLTMLNKESGLLGLSGFSSDLRDIEEKASKRMNVRNLPLKFLRKIFINISDLMHRE